MACKIILHKTKLTISKMRIILLYTNIGEVTMEETFPGDHGGVLASSSGRTIHSSTRSSNNSLGNKNLSSNASICTETSNNEPSENSPVVEMDNPLAMEGAFNEGYDLEGWEGTIGGTARKKPNW